MHQQDYDNPRIFIGMNYELERLRSKTNYIRNFRILDTLA